MAVVAPVVTVSSLWPKRLASLLESRTTSPRSCRVAVCVSGLLLFELDGNVRISLDRDTGDLRIACHVSFVVNVEVKILGDEVER